MNVNVGDTIIMKKPHPCGANTFRVLRVGMDFKIKCENYLVGDCLDKPAGRSRPTPTSNYYI